MECADHYLKQYKEPPHSVWTLKGSYPMVCCPDSDSYEDSYDNYGDEFPNDTDIYYEEYYPEDMELNDSPVYLYMYNKKEDCKEGTLCRNGNMCSSKG